MTARLILGLCLLLSSLACLARAHFVLLEPKSLGFDDDREGEGPCGGFDVKDRNTGLTDFPVSGGVVALLTTHSQSTYSFKVAVVADLSQWFDLTRALSQKGTGQFCEPQIPARQQWIGQEAVLQVTQHGHDGTLYQVGSVSPPRPFTASAPCFTSSR